MFTLHSAGLEEEKRHRERLSNLPKATQHPSGNIFKKLTASHSTGT